jgi:feruloyl esterase
MEFMKLRLVATLLALSAVLAAQTITEADCTAAKLGASIAPSWIAATATLPAYCSIDGAIAPVDPAAKPILFRVLLPAVWSGRAAQLGGGGMNGVIPNLTSTNGQPLLARGFATFGSDSGHQRGTDWALVEESIRNLGYMQLKKTHDAAMVVIQRAYGAKPKYQYFFGNSQGGREALTVAQRYSEDYDGIISNVPIVNFSSLMLAPEWIRIQEKPAANWVTPAKINAIRGEFMRQCDNLDGLADGVINNYMACRAIFSSKQDPWQAKQCPGDKDPNPADTTANACLTSGQIATLRMVYSPYRFATPLAHGVKSFGMWLPNTDPGGSGLIAVARFRGQEGAPPDAPMHSHLGVLGVTGFLMQDLTANPLDYKEGGRWNARRAQISEWLDSTDPDLTKFAKRGGKIIITIGTNDTLASPGAQLDYYQSLLDKMGRAKVDSFARLFVISQTGHGLTGSSYTSGFPIPDTYDRLTLLLDWVEKKVEPPKQVTVTKGERSLPLCGYPAYPKYIAGPPEAASSYRCAR